MYAYDLLLFWISRTLTENKRLWSEKEASMMTIAIAILFATQKERVQIGKMQNLFLVK